MAGLYCNTHKAYRDLRGGWLAGVSCDRLARPRYGAGAAPKTRLCSGHDMVLGATTRPPAPTTRRPVPMTRPGPRPQQPATRHAHARLGALVCAGWARLGALCT